MRKSVFLFSMMLAIGTAQADDYGYFVFKQSDGTETSLASSDLRITFADGKIVASSSDGSFSVALSQLSSMYFSNSSTAIETVSTDDDEDAAIYDMRGLLVAQGKNGSLPTSTLAPGVYVKKVGKTTSKILVK